LDALLSEVVPAARTEPERVAKEGEVEEEEEQVD
jgi:hypothetical protein